MIGNAFDGFTRTSSRRGSLLALGGAGLTAALSNTFSAAAKPKPGKQANKKANKKCKAQVGQCKPVFGVACEESSDPEACRQKYFACCDYLATCNAGAMAQCLV